MQSQEPVEILANQLVDVLREQTPRMAILACLLASAAIADATSDNEGAAEMMHLTADHIARGEAVAPVVPQ